MTTHTDDCLNCDFRIAKIPAKDWPEGSTREIYTHRSPYPRFLDSSGKHGTTFTPENTDMDIYPWVEGEGGTADPSRCAPHPCMRAHLLVRAYHRRH